MRSLIRRARGERAVEPVRSWVDATARPGLRCTRSIAHLPTTARRATCRQ
jgi:hypothetical protein